MTDKAHLKCETGFLFLQKQRRSIKELEVPLRHRRAIFFIFCTAAVSRHCSATLESPRIRQ